jgi:hypothetical protein
MKILKHPLDKILDDIPGGSAESIPRKGLHTKEVIEIGG